MTSLEIPHGYAENFSDQELWLRLAEERRLFSSPAARRTERFGAVGCNETLIQRALSEAEKACQIRPPILDYWKRRNRPC